MEDHARDVLGLLDALGLRRVVMGGHSFGGLLTYWLAAYHPERVERCVVLDAPAQVDPGVVEQIKPSLARLGTVYASWEEYLAFVKAMPYFDADGWSPEIEGYYRADVRVGPDGRLEARSRPDHIHAAVEGTLDGRLAGHGRPGRATDPPPARPGQLRPSGLSPHPLAGERRANRRPARQRGTRGGRGQPPHVHVRRRRSRAHGAHRAVPGAGAGLRVSGWRRRREPPFPQTDVDKPTQRVIFARDRSGVHPARGGCSDEPLGGARPGRRAPPSRPSNADGLTRRRPVVKRYPAQVPSKR